MSSVTTAPLVDVLTTLAHEDLAVGHVLTAVSGFGPDLEINIALSSMGQDELGHARAYLSLTVGADRVAINASIYDVAPEQFRGSRLAWWYPWEWERLLVKHYLYETADEVRRAAFTRLDAPDVAAAVERMEGEERYHLDFWRTWLDRTVKHDPASLAKVQRALDEAWPTVDELFPPALADVVTGLADAGDSWRRRTQGELEALGLRCSDAGSGLPDDRAKIVDELQYVRTRVPGSW